MVKKLVRCFNCFGEGHTSKSCPSKNLCFKAGCTERHHTSLHDYFMTKGGVCKASKSKKNPKGATSPSPLDADKTNVAMSKEEEAQVDEEGEHETTNMNTESAQAGDKEFSGAMKIRKDVYLQIVPVKLHGKDCTLDTYGLLDGGSQSTLIREDTAKKLRLVGTEKKVNLGTVNGSSSITVCEVALKVSARDGGNKIDIPSALVRPASHFNMPSKPCFRDQVDAYKHLDIKIDAVAPKDIEILIGANVPEALIIRDTRSGSSNQPLAVHTPFGWTFLDLPCLL